MLEAATAAPSAAHFHRNGHHVWRGFLDPDRVAGLRTLADDLLASDLALHTPESLRVFQLFRHGAPFVDLMNDPRLTELTDTLLGPHALMNDLSLNRVEPGAKPDRWHIDYPYNDMPQIVEGSLLALQCVLPLTPFSAESGATEFIPGSHQRFKQPPLSPGGTPLPAAAEPGDLIVLAASTWHRAGVNRTGLPRTAILLSFTEAWVRPMAEAPEPGPWSLTRAARVRLGMERA
ncbi:phytanoyl-CoA dioxygenase family protein [Kitasatospora sp. NBC_00315]|uniref:phytanoyl-CoA dioxygenase family protein n=1 Tax=Kitasatospora sp. NBC_00315 TaxID=2975963 RepID=UPI0032517AB4